MEKNKWKIGEAKQRFSEVVRRSESEPQLIYRRDRLVAAIVSVESESELQVVMPRSIAERFAEARILFAGEIDPIPVVKR